MAFMNHAMIQPIIGASPPLQERSGSRDIVGDRFVDIPNPEGSSVDK